MGHYLDADFVRDLDKRDPHALQLITLDSDSLPAELLSTLDEAFLWDIADIASDSELFSREWHRTIREFQKVLARRKMYELTRSSGDEGLTPAAVGDIKSQLNTLSDTLKSLEKSS